MNKELEAFRRFRANAIFDNQNEYYVSAHCVDDSDIIENALKENQKLKEEKLLLSAVRDLPNLYKKLEALEVIKEKRVDISVLIESKSLREYTDRICARVNFGRPSEQNLTYLKLTQEEYNLLKEEML